MQELFTDDEVVALCGATRSSWPLPLLTIAQDERAVRAAAFRGLRSLLVRKLAMATGAGNPVVEPELAAIVARAAAASRLVVAHVSGVEQVGWAGAGVAVFVDEQGPILDVVNATGIHGLQTVDAVQAARTIAAFVQTRFDPAEDVTPSPDGCIVVAASGQERVYRIRPGLVEVGEVAAGTAAFEGSDASSPTAVQALVEGALR